LGSSRKRSGAVRKRSDAVRRKLGGVRRKLGGVRRKLGGVRRKLGGVRRKLGGVRRKLGAVRRKFGAVRRKFGAVRRESGTAKSLSGAAPRGAGAPRGGKSARPRARSRVLPRLKLAPCAVRAPVYVDRPEPTVRPGRDAEAMRPIKRAMQPRQAEVLAQIHAAFPAEPIRFEGAFGGGLDGEAYREHVEGKTWTDLDRAYVLPHCDVLSFLDTRHLAAVLPVYLRSLVEDGTRTSVPDTMLLVLNRKSRKRFEELVNALTLAQRAAVIAVLDVFGAIESGQPADAARAALERWKSYLPTGS
jgi:hypothetical protein